MSDINIIGWALVAVGAVLFLTGWLQCRIGECQDAPPLNGAENAADQPATNQGSAPTAPSTPDGV